MLLVMTCLLLSAAPPNTTALGKAIKSGDLKGVQKALDGGTPVETRIDHSTLLGLAARSGQIEVVKLLLARGALTTAVSDYGQTPLIESFVQPDARSLELLTILKGPIDQGPETPLMNAAFRGRVELVKALLAAGANPALQDAHGDTALIDAVRSQSVPTVEALLATKKALDTGDTNGATPLTVAAATKQEPMVRLLVAAGANVNAADSSGPVLAKVTDFPGLVELLLSRGADVKKSGTAALSAAIHANRPEVVKRLLAAGAPLEPPNTLTPLMVAARAGDLESVKMLLEYTKQIDARDEQSRTALHWATGKKYNGDLIRLLLAAGADPKKKDASGQTARQLAEGLGNIDLVKVLLEKEGASPVDVSKGSWAVVFGGGKTPADAAKWSTWFNSEKPLWSSQVVFGSGFPKVMKSDDVAGMNAGFHIVVLGFCGAEQLGDVMKTFKGSAERVYARKVTDVPADASCPNALLKDRSAADVWSDDAGNRLHVALFSHGQTADLFVTLRSPEGAVIDTQIMALMPVGDYARQPAAKIGYVTYGDRDASCGELDEVQVAITSRGGKLAVDTSRVGRATPYCD